jgi:hypothetical protein
MSELVPNFLIILLRVFPLMSFFVSLKISILNSFTLIVLFKDFKHLSKYSGLDERIIAIFILFSLIIFFFSFF